MTAFVVCVCWTKGPFDANRTYMTNRRDDRPKPDSREERLRQALRANLGRRKEQARARAVDDKTDNKTAPDAGGDTGKDS